jgi:hypothetical protein
LREGESKSMGRSNVSPKERWVSECGIESADILKVAFLPTNKCVSVGGKDVICIFETFLL